METMMDRKDIRHWYGIGATDTGPPGHYARAAELYQAAASRGDSCRRAYIAGCIARAFGVDLRVTIA